LAKLTWSIHHHDLPDWAERVGGATLVIIDEAGMADTLSLDTAVQFITGRGGSVRLVGDDQQLAAVGAGGVLRDIEASHGALRLTELHHFTDPSEATATLAVREGRPEALGFYLDRQRVHVGDPTSILDNVFSGWRADRAAGLDATMLAPTRVVRGLNQRARDHRLAGATPGRQVELADNTAASVGDLIITRSNDRRLRITTADWVKNGDRWTILQLTRTGGLRVRHARNGRILTLPPDYVASSVELGYAGTVHTAQGVTADTTHGVVTGEESRQQLYTMLTRGRTANHLYVSVVGDTDPHKVIQPDCVHSRTATELLEQILARDGTPQSATTSQRVQQDPVGRLGAAAARYLDALHVAAEHLAGPQMVADLDRSADRVLDGLTGESAWQTLRGHLLLLAAAGADPVTELFTAAATRDLTSADDQAAVIERRIRDAGIGGTVGPLPWLPSIPDRIADDPNWGRYLNARSQLVAQIADHVRRNTAPKAPAWVAQLRAPVPPELIADIQVWRAATRVDPSDLRLTGPSQLGRAARNFQQQLDKRLADADTRADRHGNGWSLQKPHRHHGPVPARADRKVEQPRPCRLRRHPLPAVGFSRRTITRRSSRRGPLVAHPRPATANAEPGTRNPQRCPSNQAQDRAAARAAVGAAAGVRPEPLTRPPTQKDSPEVSAGSVGGNYF
jgi:hypothetical protein